MSKHEFRTVGMTLAAAAIGGAVVAGIMLVNRDEPRKLAENTVIVSTVPTAADQIAVLKAKYELEAAAKARELEAAKASDEATRRAAVDFQRYLAEDALTAIADRNAETLGRLQRFVNRHPDAIDDIGPKTLPEFVAFEKQWDELTSGIRAGQMPNRKTTIEIEELLNMIRRRSKAGLERAAILLPDVSVDKMTPRCQSAEWLEFSAWLASLEL